MKTIHRYAFTPTTRFEVTLPQEAEIIRLGLFGTQPCMWALVDRDNPGVARVFHMMTDDKPLDPAAVKYVGSFDMNGQLLHIFSAQ